MAKAKSATTPTPAEINKLEGEAKRKALAELFAQILARRQSP